MSVICSVGDYIRFAVFLQKSTPRNDIYLRFHLTTISTTQSDFKSKDNFNHFNILGISKKAKPLLISVFSEREQPHHNYFFFDFNENIPFLVLGKFWRKNNDRVELFQNFCPYWKSRINNRIENILQSVVFQPFRYSFVSGKNAQIMSSNICYSY